MHHSAAVCSDTLEKLVAERQASTSAAADSNQISPHGCVQPLIINTRPLILVSGHQVDIMCEATSVTVGSVVVALPLDVDCSAKLNSSVTSQNDSQSTSCTRRKRKRRRKNKVSCEASKSVFDILW